MKLLKNFPFSHLFVGVILAAAPMAFADVMDDVETATEEKNWSEVISLIKEHRDEVPDATRRLTLALLYSGHRDEALADLSRLYEKTKREDYKKLWLNSSEQFLSDDSQSHYQSALQYIRLSQWEFAKQELLEALRLDPAHPLILTRLGQVAIAQERWDDAIERLKFSFKLNPFSKITGLYLGKADIEKGNLDAADDLLKVVENDKSTPEWAWIWWADYLSKSDQVDSAKSFVLGRLKDKQTHLLLVRLAASKGWLPKKERKFIIQQALDHYTDYEKEMSKAEIANEFQYPGVLSLKASKAELELLLNQI